MENSKVENIRFRRVAYCPHCGNRSPQVLLLKQSYLERAWTSDGTESESVPWSSFVAMCETCDQLLLYENLGDQTEDERFHLCELAYPEAGHLHVSIPTAVAEIYSEAYRIKILAPNAYAILIRKALEAVCHDKGFKTGSLQNNLKKLAESGIVPPVLAEASDLLRTLGNIGAHKVGQTVHPLLASAIDEFFRAVVEYVYVAPNKLQRLRDSLTQYAKAK